MQTPTMGLPGNRVPKDPHIHWGKWFIVRHPHSNGVPEIGVPPNIPNHLKLDHFSIETYGLGIPQSKAPPNDCRVCWPSADCPNSNEGIRTAGHHLRAAWCWSTGDRMGYHYPLGADPTSQCLQNRIESHKTRNNPSLVSLSNYSN